MKTRVSLKYSVTDCRYSIKCLRIVTRRSYIVGVGGDHRKQVIIDASLFAGVSTIWVAMQVKLLNFFRVGQEKCRSNNAIKAVGIILISKEQYLTLSIKQDLVKWS